MDSNRTEHTIERASRLRFNFGFLLEASSGTSREIEIDYPQIWIAADLELSRLAGTFQAIRNSKGIYITGRLFTSYQVECARCLDPARLALAVQLDDLFYFPSSAAPPGDYGIGDDGFIDLSPLVRELVLLELPMQPFCKPDCRGLCPDCGKNLNNGDCDCVHDHLDPRLSSLMDLLDGPDKQSG